MENRGVTIEFIKEISDKVSKLKSLSNSRSITMLDSQIKELSESKINASNTQSREPSYVIDKTESYIEIPPPNDFENFYKLTILGDSLNISLSSDDDSDFEKINSHENIKKKHKELLKAVKGQLVNLKSKNEENIHNTLKFNNEIGFYKEQLSGMKKSVCDLLEETGQTKDYLHSMRGQFDSVVDNIRERDETIKEVEFDISDIKANNADASNIIEIIKQLQSKTNLIKQNIYCKESEILFREEENKDLKDLIAKINNGLDSGPKLEQEEISSSCQCIII